MGKTLEGLVAARGDDEASMTDQDFMRLAIHTAEEGVKKGQTPFGAVIALEGKLIVAAHNVVWLTTDITAHAEINAIRQACRMLDSIDLTGCVIYSTCEPCPMCFSAIHWARIDRIVYGADIADAAECGFNEMAISNEELKQLGPSPVLLSGGFMQQECVQLLQAFRARGDSKLY
ncbi:MAG: nucleoside deaminase [Armatimonadota bacterium]